MLGSRLLAAGQDGRRFGLASSILRRFFFRINQIKASVVFEVVRPASLLVGSRPLEPGPEQTFEPRRFGRRDRGARGSDGKRSHREMAPQGLEKE